MIALRQLYHCRLCGNVVEVMFNGSEALVCCGEPMKLLVENTVDAAKEKHVPVMDGNDYGVKVKVGSVLHPSEEQHYIVFIEVIATDNMIYSVDLKPGSGLSPVFERS